MGEMSSELKLPDAQHWVAEIWISCFLCHLPTGVCFGKVALPLCAFFSDLGQYFVICLGKGKCSESARFLFSENNRSGSIVNVRDTKQLHLQRSCLSKFSC